MTLDAQVLIAALIFLGLTLGFATATAIHAPTEISEGVM